MSSKEERQAAIKKELVGRLIKNLAKTEPTIISQISPEARGMSYPEHYRAKQGQPAEKGDSMNETNRAEREEALSELFDVYMEGTAGRFRHEQDFRNWAHRFANAYYRIKKVIRDG